MTEQQALGVAIRIIGIWRIAMTGGDSLYFVLFGNRTDLATNPAILGLQGLILNLAIGGALLFAAPAIVRLIYRSKSSQP